jgi:hypothetical protein
MVSGDSGLKTAELPPLPVRTPMPGSRPLRDLHALSPALRAVFSKVDTLAVFMTWFLPAPPLAGDVVPLPRLLQPGKEFQ